jgi:hypothetical protein
LAAGALLAAVLAAACAGATPEVARPTPLPGAEDGGCAVVIVPFVVDLVSLVPSGADLAILVRVDLLRGSRAAPFVQEVLRSEGGELTRFVQAGVDPLQDVDRLLVAGREAGDGPDVVALEHRWSEQQLLDLYTRLSRVPAGTTPELQALGRFRAVSLPGARVALLVLSPTMAAFAPHAMVATVLERAQAPGSDAGDTGRRLRMLEAVAPDLAPAAVVRISADSLGGRADWSREMGQFGLPAPDWTAVVVRLDDGASAFARAGYRSELEAEATERTLRALLTQSFHPATLLLRVMGLARALEASQVAIEASEVTFRTHLAADELDRVLERLRSGGP